MKDERGERREKRGVRRGGGVKMYKMEEKYRKTARNEGAKGGREGAARRPPGEMGTGGGRRREKSPPLVAWRE